jgi:hypothetical protein
MYIYYTHKKGKEKTKKKKMTFSKRLSGVLYGLLKTSAAVKIVDDDTVVISDVAYWDSKLQNEVMYYFPECRIYFEMNVHSLSGFVIRFQKGVSDSAFWMAYLLLVLSIGCCIYFVYVHINK